MLLEIKINLHPINFIIISGILQSMILAIALIFNRNGNKSANKLIGLLILIFSLHFSWSLIIDSNLDDIFISVFWLPYSYLLAIGPLLFLYTRSLTEENFSLGKNELIHFLPAAVEIFVQLLLIRQSMRSDILLYNVRGFILFRIIEFAAVATSILAYGKQCLALIRTHEAWISEHFSNQKDITLLWLLRLIRYLRVLLISWLVFELSFILFWQFQLHFITVYLLLYILLGVTTYSNYWIGIQALIKSATWTEKKVIKPISENTSVYAKLNEAEMTKRAEALHQLMLKEKLYLHETLSLRTLAARLQIDPNLLSYILNNIFHKSFYDYVNEFRVEEVKQKISDPAHAHFKIVEIAFECGFNSKASFNRVFKKLTGKSPSEYKNESTTREA
jgi:AraC-like DNA-binding protein